MRGFALGREDIRCWSVSEPFERSLKLTIFSTLFSARAQENSLVPNLFFSTPFLFLMASNRIYIGRLSRDAQKRDVEDLFTGSGQIRDVNLKNGFGFVEFEDNQSAEDAVTNFNGKELLGER
jgi:RNA recognition motif-containing protein